MNKLSPDQDALKSIFVISPIGIKPGDEVDTSEIVLNEIIKPAVAAVGGYEVPLRADKVQQPGSIKGHIITTIIGSDVCIADLTGRNPNVMYEVAIAHAADKPVILLQQEPGGPPFDFSDERVIHYGLRADQANAAQRHLQEHLRNAFAETDSSLARVMHPVRTLFRTMRTSEAAQPAEAAIIESLRSLNVRVETLSQQMSEADYATRRGTPTYSHREAFRPLYSYARRVGNPNMQGILDEIDSQARLLHPKQLNALLPDIETISTLDPGDEETIVKLVRFNEKLRAMRHLAV